MLGHRLRRWPNIGPTLGRCVAFVGLAPRSHHSLNHHSRIIAAPQSPVCVRISTMSDIRADNERIPDMTSQCLSSIADVELAVSHN